MLSTKKAFQYSAPMLLLIVLLFSLASCGTPPPHITVFLGNYFFGRGDYQEATVQYLKALNNTQSKSWIYYNLANVYHSLGEVDAALEFWEEVLKTDSEYLLFAAHYNRGILFYEQSRYENAFEDFKAALTYDSAHIGAKLNLELTLLKLQSGRIGNRRSQQESNRELSTESIRIFEYIRRKEEQSWVEQDYIPRVIYVEDW
ncbi:MAG: tetratricopeptide repeat protein [Salinispira sp.]